MSLSKKLLLTTFVACSALFLNAASKPRFVAIGDIHGADAAFVSILQKAQLINANQEWIADNTIFIQTGDVLDRGPGSRKAMDLLLDLEKQAPKKNGKVIALLGNHEVMNIVGDLRYVSAEEYASYSDSKSAKTQDAAFKAYENFLKQRAERFGVQPPAFTKEMEQDWKQKHPLGFVEHRDAFSKKGRYGRWLRKQDAIAVVDGNVFLHGGISLEVKELSFDELNRRIHQELNDFDSCREYLQGQKAALPFFTVDEIVGAAKQELEIQKQKRSQGIGENKTLERCTTLESWLIMHPDGPLWFRGFATWNDSEGSANIQELIQKYKVTRFITAHTVMPDGQIRSRFNGQIFLIDTGMLSGSFFPGGRASALEINDGTVTPIY
ncbi:metallophosphoesterase [bacterium]|nr:metallophosphoesterase [bacterium]